MEYYKENINLLIFEEDAGFKDFLIGLLQESGYHQINAPKSLEEALHFVQSGKASVCLIALNNTDKAQNGLRLAENIRDLPVFIPIVFFARFYNENVYAVCRSFQPSAFLNKELSPFKLQLALEQAVMHRMSGENMMEAKTSPLRMLPQPLFFKTATGFIAIPEKKILYFHSNQKTTYARTAQQTYDTQVQLQILESALEDQFVRIHKSYLININCIDSIQPNESTVVIAGETLPIGYTYRKSFFNRIKILR